MPLFEMWVFENIFISMSVVCRAQCLCDILNVNQTCTINIYNE